MSDLEQARKEIERIDREMAALFSQRLTAVETVAAYKTARGLPIVDPEREARLTEKNAALVENSVHRAYYLSFLKDVIALSCRYQAALRDGMKVAYCGIQGAFADIAAKRIFPHGQAVSYPDFASAYRAVETGECACCVLPIENSYAGEVGQVVDLMFSGPLFVNGVYSLPIRQHLLGVPGASVRGIKTVLSHPQALGQCADYIRAHGFTAAQAANTAVAAQEVAKSKDTSVAAIASRETAALYGLEVLDHDINESAVNSTRFAVFSRVEKERSADDATFILLFTVTNTVGALAKAVNIISANGFDMRVLRSRPVKDVPWQYYFYVEAQGNANSEEGKQMLRALSVCCEHFKIVGHFGAETDLGKEPAGEAGT